MSLHSERLIPPRGANKGTRPGHPYADVVFSYAFHKRLESIAEELDSHGLRPLVPTAKFDFATGTLEEGSTFMTIVAFFDDFVIPITTKTPGAFMGACSKALGIIADNLARRGIFLNSAKGKTEVMLTFHGSEAALERHRVFATSCPPISSSSPLAGDITVEVTRVYKHLGTFNCGPNRYEPDNFPERRTPTKRYLRLRQVSSTTKAFRHGKH